MTNITRYYNFTYVDDEYDVRYYLYIFRFSGYTLSHVAARRGFIFLSYLITDVVSF